MTTHNVALERAEDAPVELEPRPPLAGMVKLSWAGLLGGIVVAVGLWMLLTILGLAIGFASFDPDDSLSAVKTVGMGAGIWTIVVSILALFVGGLVTARTSGILDRPGGAIHGAVLWSVTTILSLVLVTGVVRSVVAGAASGASAAAGAAVRSGGGVSEAMGIDTNDLVAPLNDRLRAEGKPTVTPSQLQAVIRDSASTALREGRVDRDVLTTSIARNTGLSEADARELAGRMEVQVNSKARTVANDVREGAFGAADAVGKGLLWLVLGMALGLGAAIFGSTIGVSRRQRTAAGVGGVGHRGLREAHAHST